MKLHPSVHRLSRRLLVLLPLVGGASALTYALSLAQDVYPGYSASLVAAAAGLAPQSQAAHPLFSCLARLIADLGCLSLPVRLNLFSAACGTLCAMLLGLVVGRLILFAGCEDAGGARQTGLIDGVKDPSLESELPAEVNAYNRSVARNAVWGGAVAALVFAFSVPVWSAATRLDNNLLTLSIALIAMLAFPARYASLYSLKLALSVFLFALGLFESSLFMLALPVFAYFLFRALAVEAEDRRAACFASAAAGAAGAAVSVLAFRANMAGASDIAGLALLHTYARELWAHHMFETRSFFPSQGWLLLALQVGLPAGLLLFGLQSLYKDRRLGTAAILVLLVLAVAPALLNLPISPVEIFAPSGHLPVLGAALMAAAAAVVLTACALLVHHDGGRDDEVVAARSQKQEDVLRALAFVLLVAVSAGCAVSLWLGFARVDNARGAFADQIAREVLGQMGKRTCLVTNGYLDNHLLVQARLRGVDLALVTLRGRTVARETDAIRKLIEASPLFEGQNRVRLQNALSISTVRFVMEWFAADPRAAEKAMVLATPDIWTGAGYRFRPEGLAFGGARADEPVDWRAVTQVNRAFAERVAPLLRPRPLDDGAISGLRMFLQMRAGFAANELGVLLEGQGDWEGAFTAYQRALEIDTQNASAAVNLYELCKSKKLRPEQEDVLKKRMRTALARVRVKSVRDITWVLQNYGTIHQQAFYQQQMAEWTLWGGRAVAADKAQKAQSLAAKTGTASLIADANTYLQSGDEKKAEACFASAVERDAQNRDALIGLCTLMIGQKRVAEAESWMKKGLAAGIEPLAMRYQTVMLAILKGEKDRAVSLLKAATAEAASDSRYWALLADLLLERGDVQYVERQLLPDMQLALKSPDHYLVQAVRGMTLQSKGPKYFKEARHSLLAALSQNASLADLWSALLRLDLAIGSAEFTEADVRKLLGIYPEHAFANYLMGARLLAGGRLKEAEDFFRRSIEKTATSAALNDLAECLRQQKRLAEAEASARRALELDPGLTAAQDTLANVLCDGGRFADAEAAAALAVASKAAYMPYQLTLLRAEIGLQKREAAQSRLKILDGAKYAVPSALRGELAAMK
jgi:tetratricopeptide (TPR) repeat protein